MVCFSAAVLTKGGKPLLARNFVEISRHKIENLLQTFPKLLGTDKQHSTIETDEVRYLYRPLEGLILLIITSKHSNIVQDLDVLRLFAQVQHTSYDHTQKKNTTKNETQYLNNTHTHFFRTGTFRIHPRGSR